MNKRTNIYIPEDLHRRHTPNFSKKVCDALEFWDKVKELKKQYPDDATFGAVVRGVL
jgi:hypothetical protein